MTGFNHCSDAPTSVLFVRIFAVLVDISKPKSAPTPTLALALLAQQNFIKSQRFHMSVDYPRND